MLCTLGGGGVASGSPAPRGGAYQQVHHLRSPLWLCWCPGYVDVPSAVRAAVSAERRPWPCSACSAGVCPAAHTLLGAASQGLPASGPRPAAGSACHAHGVITSAGASIATARPQEQSSGPPLYDRALATSCSHRVGLSAADAAAMLTPVQCAAGAAWTESIGQGVRRAAAPQ